MPAQLTATPQGPWASLAAVNDEMAQWDSAISEGDEILFFPPVAGG